MHKYLFIHFILEFSQRRKFNTREKSIAEKIRSEYNKQNETPICTSTVKKCFFTVDVQIREFGLHDHVAARKPLLRPKYIKKQLIWAKNHQHWTVEQSKNVL